VFDHQADWGDVLRDIIEQYEHNVRKGPLHESSELLPCQAPDVYPVRYLAYYLPQFHTIKVNDDAWGKGFTEWTNTTKALPRYIGQYQPRLPADLGFYNLNDPGVIRKQVDLARRGGIYGFCLHYYWFSGKKILNKPLSLILSNADIDFPFCINWANESWTRTWDGTEQSVLLKQEYREEDPLLFAQDLAELVQDRRYITVHGRPLIMLYRPGVVPDIPRTVDIWREFFLKQGLRDPYIIMPQAFGDDDPLAYGLDAAAGFPPHKCGFSNRNDRWKLKALDPDFVGVTVSYDRMIDEALSNRPTEFRYFPGVCPQWDNEARRPKRGFSVYGSTPQRSCQGFWLSCQWQGHAPKSCDKL
jgi:hypothetical protein